MAFRRVNRSKKVPGVKLRPADPSARKDLRTPDSTWTHSSGLDSDEDTTHADLCPRPFKRFVLCATGINDKTSLFKLALELGAQSEGDLTDRTTHLIAEESGSAKYRCALESGIPIMHPSWIIESHKIWLKGDDVDVAEGLDQFRLPPFTGVVLSVSGIEDVNIRMEINRKVTKGGGMYVKQIERPVRVTHLICANTSEGESEKVRYAEKFNRVGEARIHIVWEDWFWDSLRFGGRFDEEAYKVSNPRPQPRALPDPPPASSTVNDDLGVSSEIENAQASAAGGPPASRPGDDDEEIASVKRVPAVTLHLWESILKPRGFELQQGRLVRSPSKSQAQAPKDTSYRREPSPSARALRRGSLKEGDGDPHMPASAISSFRRARSFAPVAQSTPVSRHPFRRLPTVGGSALAGHGGSARTASFAPQGHDVGGAQAAWGISADWPTVSASAVAGPSRAGSVVPENGGDNTIEVGDVGGGVSEGARELFKGKRIRALGEARCASVRRAIEDCGGSWVGASDDDDDGVDFIIVRLVSGSALYRREGDERERTKYRTECWLERCIFEERICAPEEHLAFTPLQAEAPIPGTEDMIVSYSGLEQSEACWVRRLLRGLGIMHAPNFSRRTTHLLCPSGEGAKAEKAREWGTPVVDMEWLGSMARTGEVPPIAPTRASPSVAGEGEDVDLNVVDYQGEPEVLLPTQQPPSVRSGSGSIDKKGKCREKGSRGASMIDITNDQAPRAQSLSYYDPPPADPALPPAEESESFGVPSLLLGEAEADKPPDIPPPASTTPTPPTSKSPTPPTEPEPEAAPRTQPCLASDANVVLSLSTPSLSLGHNGRVPSSASPSPMRIPGTRTPTTPAHVKEKTTKVLQETITTLLGKRPAAAVAPAEHEIESAKRAKGANAPPLGRRSRPLNRSKSNMSLSECGTPGRTTPPVLSPVASARSRARTATPAPVEVPVEVPAVPPRPTGSGDEGDNSFIAAEVVGGTHVQYADPQQDGVRERLNHLFDASAERLARQEMWEAAGAGAGVSMDVEEMTLQQLPEAVPAAGGGSGRKGAGKGRRGRGRKGARG
ncbi:hypothetical protein BC628DRAFT_1499098 [Trametes gibbosa]|nr:hypothetical protein BC628DRAFT_1499098 [Trametes gibbosa]